MRDVQRGYGERAHQPGDWTPAAVVVRQEQVVPGGEVDPPARRRRTANRPPEPYATLLTVCYCHGAIAEGHP